jgi:hypothetical protein
MASVHFEFNATATLSYYTKLFFIFSCCLNERKKQLQLICEDVLKAMKAFVGKVLVAIKSILFFITANKQF